MFQSWAAQKYPSVAPDYARTRAGNQTADGISSSGHVDEIQIILRNTAVVDRNVVRHYIEQIVDVALSFVVSKAIRESMPA